MLQQILVLLLSLFLVILFLIAGSNLTAVVSCKGVSASAELLQHNDASDEMVLVDNMHAATGKESNIVVEKNYSRYGSSLTPIQRSSSTTMKRVESPAGVADRKNKRKFSRRSLIVKEEKNESGFVAYSADYGKPRHHPPKNN